jgi:hypothetical protein
MNHFKPILLFAGCLLASAQVTLPPLTYAQVVKLTWVSSTYTNVGGYRIYAWTNLPDAQCQQSNAVQTTLVGNVTAVQITRLLPTDYTFAATAVDTNSGAESLFSNFAHWPFIAPPSYLISVQSTTNLLTPWTTVTNSSGQVFFRLVISPQ